MLLPGDPAPDFDLPSAHGGEGRVRLRDLLDAPDARRGLVLYVYPADFTPLCTAQACMFRDAHDELRRAGYGVVGLSPQGQGSHEKFAARHALGFTLLSDPDRRVIRAYGCAGPLGLGVRRTTYLIARDASGVARVVDAVRADVRLSKHRGFVARALAAAT